MTSKTKQSGRVDILVRMTPELKSRVIEAAEEDGLTNNDWLIDAIEQALAARDAEVNAEKKKADLEHQRDMKFEEIALLVAVNAGVGDVTSLGADKLIEHHEEAEAAIDAWRNQAASNFYAEPRTPLERLCKEYCDLEEALEGGVPRIDTFGDRDILADDDDDFEDDD